MIVADPDNPDVIFDQQALDNEFYAAALNELVHLGLDLARTIHRQATAQAQDSPLSRIDEHAGLAFERVSRAVRRSIMLAQRLNDPRRNEPAPEPKPVATRAGTRLEELATTGIHDDRLDDNAGGQTERLRADRLDTPDWDDEPEDGFGNRPFLESINEIRRDLGLSPLAPPPEPAPEPKIGQLQPGSPPGPLEKPAPARGTGWGKGLEAGKHPEPHPQLHDPKFHGPPYRPAS